MIYMLDDNALAFKPGDFKFKPEPIPPRKVRIYVYQNKIQVDGWVCHLSNQEMNVLAALALHSPRIMPYDELIPWVWSNPNTMPLDPRNSLAVHITRIRAKLKEMPAGCDIVNHHAHGFAFRTYRTRVFINFRRERC